MLVLGAGQHLQEREVVYLAVEHRQISRGHADTHSLAWRAATSNRIAEQPAAHPLSGMLGEQPGSLHHIL